MAFRLRQIVYSASGRQIARDRVLAGPQLRLGRGGDNDIVIADLAVEPQHATITLEPGGRLTVQSVGTLGFVVDGKAARVITLDPATPAELRFGSTMMAVARDAGGDVLIEVHAADTAGVIADPVSDKARFSLGGGSRGLVWGAVIAILALFLALPVASHWSHASAMKHPGAVIGDKTWSPGALSLAHHTLSNNCEACHVKPFQSVRNATCVACHKDAHDHAAPDRLAMARGVPGTGARMLLAVGHVFGREPAGACTDCHVEHQGARPMDPPRQQFCASCHNGLAGRVRGTALGNAADFGTAHPEFRAWVVTDANTRLRAPVSLAAHPHEDNGLTFSHRIHLDAAGGVAKMAMTLDKYGKPLACASCHVRSADGVGFEPVRMERDCEACHSLVYDKSGPTFLRLRHGDLPQMIADLTRARPAQVIATGRARPGDFGPGGLYGARFSPSSGIAARALAKDGICGECHTAQWRAGHLGVQPVTLVSRYMPNGWFDHAAHRQTACADCHAAARSDKASDVLLPRMESCRNCHLGENAVKPKVPSGCAMCHSYHQTGMAPTGARRRDAEFLLEQSSAAP